MDRAQQGEANGMTPLKAMTHRHHALHHTWTTIRHSGNDTMTTSTTTMRQGTTGTIDKAMDIDIDHGTLGSGTMDRQHEATNGKAPSATGGMQQRILVEHSGTGGGDGQTRAKEGRTPPSILGAPRPSLRTGYRPQSLKPIFLCPPPLWMRGEGRKPVPGDTPGARFS